MFVVAWRSVFRVRVGVVGGRGLCVCLVGGRWRRAAGGDVVTRAVEGVGGGGFDDVGEWRGVVALGRDWLGGEQHGGGDGAESGDAGGDQPPGGGPGEEGGVGCRGQLGGGRAEPR